MLAAVAVLRGGGLLGGNGVARVAGSSAAASASADPVPTTSGPTTPGPTTPAPVDAKPWRLVRVGDPVTVTAPFTDPGTNDTHRCDIAWDDGTAFSGPARNHECRATHAYRHAGMFTVKTVVTDDDGGSAEAPGLLVVVYDPAAGPARGSGRIRSGRFDFTASYPPAATGPVGSVGVDLPPPLGPRDPPRPGRV